MYVSHHLDKWQLSEQARLYRRIFYYKMCESKQQEASWFLLIYFLVKQMYQLLIWTGMIDFLQEFQCDLIRHAKITDFIQGWNKDTQQYFEFK